MKVQKTIKIPISDKTTKEKLEKLNRLTACLTYGVQLFLNRIIENDVTTVREAEKFRKEIESITGLPSAFVQACRDKALWMYRSYKQQYREWKRSVAKLKKAIKKCKDKRKKRKLEHKLYRLRNREPSLPTVNGKIPVMFNYRIGSIEFSYSAKEFRAKYESITQEEALYILKKVQTIDKFLELAKIASKVRDEEVGAVFKFDGFIGSITPCTTNPPCKYCSRSAGNHPDFAEKPLTIEEIELGAKLIDSTGTKRVELGGGTLWNGAGEKVIEAVKAVKKVSSMDIWINVGPALNKNDLIRLKELGVKEVCSSLETINPKVFKEAKPGDSLEARMKLAEEINEVGLGFKSVMMVGMMLTLL